MSEYHHPVVQRVIESVRDGVNPPSNCVNCGASSATRRELYAVCTQVRRRWESTGSGGFVAGMIGLIPFYVPLGSPDAVEIREGQDLSVAVPVNVCDACWQRLDGGKLRSFLSGLSQALCVAGVAMLLWWLFAESRGGRFSIFWIFGCFALALPFYLAAEVIQSRWHPRVLSYLRRIDVYEGAAEGVSRNADPADETGSPRRGYSRGGLG